MEALATTAKQPIDEKMPPGHDDAPRSYTPYIKYTKLEFKVKERRFLVLCVISCFFLQDRVACSIF